MDRKLPFLVTSLLLLIAIIFVYIVFSKPLLVKDIPLVRQYFSTVSPSDLFLITPTPTPTKSPDYVIPINRDKNAPLQINGAVEHVGVESVTVSSGGDRYTASADSSSYVECRDKYITSEGKLVPAHTIFYDLSRYVTTLEEKGKAEAFLEKGLLLRYPDVQERIISNTNVLAVMKDKPKTTKGFSKHVLLLIVYGCK